MRSLRDVALANRFFGGRRAVLAEVQRVVRAVPSKHGTAGASQVAITLLDIGTGLGDIPRAAQRLAARRAIPMTTIGVELVPALARAAGTACTYALAADAMALPFPDASIDIVTCSQVLHHFDGAEAERLLQECTRVARTAVIIGDLRRSWCGGWPLGGIVPAWVPSGQPPRRHRVDSAWLHAQRITAARETRDRLPGARAPGAGFPGGRGLVAQPT